MADKNSYPLSLILKAVDRITAPLRNINAEIGRMTAPARTAGNAIASIGKVGGLKQLREGIGGVLSDVRTVGNEFTSLTKRVAVGLGAAGFAAYEFIQPAVEGGAALKFQAQRLDVTTDELASYRFAAKEAGIEQGEFTKGLDFFNKTLGQAKAGRGTLRGLLGGVTGGAKVLQQLLSAKTTGDALGVLLARMDELPDKEKRAALSAASFGKGAMNMENLAELGAKRIADLRREFLATAGSQEDFAAGSTRVIQAEAALDAAWTGTRNTLLVPLFPILLGQLRDLTGWLVTHRQVIREWADEGAQAVGRFAQSLPSRIQSFMGFVSRVRSVLQPIADMVGGWPTLFIGVAGAIVAGPLLGALAQLTASIVTLGLAIGLTPFGWLLAGLAAVALAVVMITGKYNNMFDAAYRALHPGQPQPLDGSHIYSLDEAQQELEKRNRTPGQDVLSPRGPLTVDASGLSSNGSPRPTMQSPLLSGTGAAAASSGAPWEWHPTGDASQVPGAPRDVHASLKIEVAAPKGTKVSNVSSTFDDLMLSVGKSLAEAH